MVRCSTYQPEPSAAVLEAGAPAPPPSRQDAAPDAAPNGPRRCAANAPFERREAVSGLESELPRGTLRLSNDELTAVFSQWSESRAAWDLWMARRSSSSAPFEEAQPIVHANSGAYQRYPTISADGLTLFFDRVEKSEDNPENAEMFRLGRADRGADFEIGQYIEGMPSSTFEPYFGFTPGTVYFTRIDPNVKQWTIQRAELSSNIVRSTAELYRTQHGASTPVVSADEQEMYLYIYEAAETDGGEELGYPTRVVRANGGPFVESYEGLDLAEGEFTWLSPDACRLYFTFQEHEEVDGDVEPPSGKLFVLTRTP